MIMAKTTMMTKATMMTTLKNNRDNYSDNYGDNDGESGIFVMVGELRKISYSSKLKNLFTEKCDQNGNHFFVKMVAD